MPPAEQGAAASAAFVGYLRSKATVDARALNREVRAAAAAAIRRRAAALAPAGTFRALEVGAGAGHAFSRWMDLLAPCPRVDFLATDADPAVLAVSRGEALRWGAASDLTLTRSEPDHIAFEGAGADSRRVDIRLRPLTLPEETPPGRFDLVVSQSLWDLLPRGAARDFAARVLAPGGVFHAALTFAGATMFAPPHPSDAVILDNYHRSMGGARGGDPNAGDRLVEDFRAPGSGFRELASGRSDWAVIPEGGRYHADERLFLETILGFVEKEAAANPAIPEAERRDWSGARRAQLAEGRLAYTARQMDLAAERISPANSSSR